MSGGLLSWDEQHTGSSSHENPTIRIHESTLDESNRLAQTKHLTLTHQRTGSRSTEETQVHIDR